MNDWQEGPLPPSTYNWGGVITTEMVRKGSQGFLLGSFCGNCFRPAGSKEVIKPEQIAFYNNSIKLPRLKRTSKVEMVGTY